MKLLIELKGFDPNLKEVFSSFYSVGIKWEQEKILKIFVDEKDFKKASAIKDAIYSNKGKANPTWIQNANGWEVHADDLNDHKHVYERNLCPNCVKHFNKKDLLQHVFKNEECIASVYSCPHCQTRLLINF